MADSLVQSATGSSTSTFPAAAWGTATTDSNLLTATLVYAFDAAVTGVPSGWTLEHRVSSTSLTVEVYHIIGAATRSGAETWTLGGSCQWTLTLAEFSGMSPSCVVDAVADSGIALASGLACAPQSPTGGTHTLALFVSSEFRFSATLYTRTALDGPFTFTEIADVALAGAGQQVRQVSAYQFKAEYSWPTEAARLLNASGGSIAGTSAMVVFRDAASATPPSNINVGGAGSEVQRDTAESAAAAGGNTLTATLPATSTAGNLLVVSAAEAGADAPVGILTPAGYTLVDTVTGIRGFNTAGTIGQGTQAVFYKVSDGTETGIVVDFQQSLVRNLFMVEVSGITNTLVTSVKVPSQSASPWESIEGGGLFVSPSTGLGMGVGLGDNLLNFTGAMLAFCVADAVPVSDAEGGFTLVQGLTTTGLFHTYFLKRVSGDGRPRLIGDPGTTGRARVQGIIVCFGAVGVTTGPLELPQTQLNLKVFPNKTFASILDGMDS